MSEYLPWTVEHMAAEEMQQDWSDLRFQSVFHDAYKAGGEYVKHYADNRIAELESQLAATKAELESLREQYKIAIGHVDGAVTSVCDLIDNSVGVIGLHMNGDVAPWSSLRGEGHFCEWLAAVDDAENFLYDASNPCQSPT